MTSVSFLGLRTRKLEAMRRLYAEAYCRPVLREAPGAVWFQLDDGAELHVSADSDGNVYEVMGPSTRTRRGPWRAPGGGS